MNKPLSLAMAGAALCALLGSGHAAEPGTETRPIDARVTRVKIDGAVDLRIRQGAPATLMLSGDPRGVSAMVTSQNGDTLDIEGSTHGHVRMGGLHAELVLPALREVTSDSLGATDIAGFSGDTLVLTLDGAGSMRVAGNYRMLKASLGGVGSMTLQGLNCESVIVDLQGAGLVALSGRGASLKADLGGLGSLDAQQFAVDNVSIDLSGLGNASVTARQSANLDLSGLGTVTVYGKPGNRKVDVDGLGKVIWK